MTDQTLNMRTSVTHGIVQIMPIMVPTFVLGMVFGAISRAAGLNVWEILMSSLFLYTGAGQFLFVTLYSAGHSFWTILLLVAILGTRHLALTGTLLDIYNTFSKCWRFLVVYWLTDEVFACIVSTRARKKIKVDKPFVFASSLTEYTLWSVSTVLGALLPLDTVPGISNYANFLSSIIFLCIALGLVTNIKKGIYFLCIGSFSVLFYLIIPSGFGALATIAVGVGVAALFAGKRQKGAVQ